jgi:hypothetical protein
VTVVLAAGVFVHARASHTVLLSRATPFDVMLWKAATPFQYRLLIPKLGLLAVPFVYLVLPPFGPFYTTRTQIDRESLALSQPSP